MEIKKGISEEKETWEMCEKCDVIEIFPFINLCSLFSNSISLLPSLFISIIILILPTQSGSVAFQYHLILDSLH